MLFVSALQTRISSSLLSLYPLDHQGGWLPKCSTTVVVGVAVATVVWRRAWIRRKKRQRIQESPKLKTREEEIPSQDSELKCSCGLPAKLRMSRNFQNPYRLFYNCPNNSLQHKCEYFRWSDEISESKKRRSKEINYLRHECIQLHKKIMYVQAQRENDRAVWEREKSVLRSKVLSVRAVLNDIKRRIQPVYGTDNMPPIDESYSIDDDDDDDDNDGVKVIEAM